MFDWYEDEVKQLEARKLGTGLSTLVKDLPAPGSVVFYGSSSIRLWDSLATDIGPLTGDPPRPIVNLGFGGSTLDACVHYFDRLPGRVAREAGPIRSLIFYAGENDLGDGRSVDAVFDSFIWLHAMVRDRLPGVPFAFLSIKPSPSRAALFDRIRAVNAKIQERIRERPESLFIDIHRAMLDESGKPRSEYWTADGIHMSRAGYTVWTEILALHQDQLFR